MGFSMSNDLLLGIVIGAILILVVQQLTRLTGSLGRFIPLLLLIACSSCSVLAYWWWLN
jgi:hypothetical protein